MTRWPRPDLPRLPGSPGAVRVWDTSTSSLRPAALDETARLYVCGITPYDSTHLGHAATYVAFDLLNRVLRDAGHAVTYVQNVTDVDDPLLERADATGVDWRELAAEQTDLFASDMTALRVIPPEVYLGVVEALPLVVATVEKLVGSGHAYALPAHGDEPAGDLYLDLHADPTFGRIAHLGRDAMLAIFAERGGDPDRPGKRDPLDPLLWRVARPGEPSWEAGSLPAGRPGWHVECTAIALAHLGMGFDVQGGGSDLAFPHHEMGATHAHLLTGDTPYARSYVHSGMVGFEGHKMSKSRGNLVLVSRLRSAGHEPAAIRLALLAHHYRSDWEWTPPDLAAAQVRLQEWRRAVTRDSGPDAGALLAAVRERLADDLDAPGALAAVDAWAAAEGPDAGAPGLARDTLDALLGIRLEDA